MKKLTYEYIKENIELEGYILLTNYYINSKHKLRCICRRGHLYNVTWSDWKSKKRCPKCYHIDRAKRLRLDFNGIKKEFRKEGCYIQSTEYINVDQKLDYICKRGHKHSISWHNWKSGWRCPYCHHEDLSKKMSGINHPNWKGGISKKSYCQDWTNDLKELVKERDGFKCLNPCCLSKTPKDLTVHHIDYNKKSCGAENLITVCRSCNSRANTNRNWHEAWYKAILNKRYNYK